MTKNIFMKGLPVRVSGTEVMVGDKASDFTVIGNSLEPVKLSDFTGKIVVLSCVPSLDTPTCELETRRFNQEASQLSGDVVVLTVSRDLPFAQARWCAANGIKNVITLSDYKNLGFANQYGVLLEDLGLLTRAIFVIDKEGIISYIQFVEEVSSEPDYAQVIEAVKKLM